MTSIVFNSDTAKTSLGDILSSATGGLIQITDESGATLAHVVLHAHGNQVVDPVAIKEAESQIADLRRRRSTDRSKDVTTAQLLANAQSAAKA